ncbi:alginate export family protein [Akkermansiaceae bacterium]|nr:alginate export family protein [Akkermansiaceae bacterium]
MKTIYLHIQGSLLSLSLLATAFADGESFGDRAQGIVLPDVNGGPDAVQWLTPSVDLRTRFEHRDFSGLDSSNSLTARARVGLTLGSFNGFSAKAELETTGVLVDDFDAGPGTNRPNNPGQTLIRDPENFELNQAWIQYKKNGFLAQVGRQKITRNDLFHIGNVGWRQSEQTYDAVQLAHSTDDYTLSYAYSNEARRIFGNGAGGFAESFTGDFHIVDATYNSSVGKVGAYAYFLDIDNNSAVGRSNSYGVFGTFGSLLLEVAIQEGDSSIASGNGSYTAFLARANYTLDTESGTFSTGIDWKQDDYKTPFQTAHAFFGFADSFLPQQIGLNKANDFDGIFNAHLKYSKSGLPGNVTFKSALHYFASEDLAITYGYEADAAVIKKFTENLTGIAKAAYFAGDNTFPDVRQFTLDLNYKF